MNPVHWRWRLINWGVIGAAVATAVGIILAITAKLPQVEDINAILVAEILIITIARLFHNNNKKFQQARSTEKLSMSYAMSPSTCSASSPASEAQKREETLTSKNTLPEDNRFYSSPPAPHFRFGFHSAIVIFTDEDIRFYNAIPRRWIALTLGILFSLIGGMLYAVLANLSQTVLGTVTIVMFGWLGFAYWNMTRFRKMILLTSNMSSEEVMQLRKKPSYRVGWQKIRSVRLSPDSVLIKWGQGLKRGRPEIFYDDDENGTLLLRLKEFLSQKLGDRLRVE
jgi:hypothetical protein